MMHRLIVWVLFLFLCNSRRATGSRWQTIVKSVGENSYEEKKVFQFR